MARDRFRSGGWRGWRRWTFAGVSLVVHTALIAALVVATEEEAAVAAEPVREEVTYVDISAFPPPPPPPAAAQSQPEPEPARQPQTRPATTPRPRPPTPSTPPRVTDIVEPELDSIPEPLGDIQPIRAPDVEGPPAGAVAATPQPGGRPGGQAGGQEGGVEGGRVGGQVGATPPSGGTFVEAVVDRRAELTNRRQLPRIMERLYPSLLRDSGTGGRVVVQFVVDTNGRIDMSTVKVISSSHDGFVDATKKALREFRFSPARMGDQTVRMLTQMPIVWQVEGS